MIKNYSKKIVIGSIVAIVVVAAIMYFRSGGKQAEYTTAVVERGDVIEEVSITGSIAPPSKVKLQPEVTGQVDSILVEEGDEVKEGDLLLKIAAGDIEARVQGQRAALDSARARLRELEAGATDTELRLSESALETAQSRLDAAHAGQADAETAFDNADKNLANVQAKAETLLQSKINETILDFDSALTVATDAITRLSNPLFSSQDLLTFTSSDSASEANATHTRLAAKSALTRMSLTIQDVSQGSMTAGDVLAASELLTADLTEVKLHLDADVILLDSAAGLSSTTLATYQQNVNTALSNVNLALQTLSTNDSNLDLQQKLNDADITAAEIALSNASASLTTAVFSVDTAEKSLAQSQAELELLQAGTREEIIASQRARVNLEQANLSGLLNDLSKRRITAPIDAVVTLIAVEEGETVQMSQSAVILNAKGNFDIIANISEIDIAQVSVGDTVYITLDAFTSDEKWTGKVVAIQPAEKVVEGIIFYETTVKFDTEDPRLRSGMTANLDIETDRSEAALFVPYRALRETDERTYVERMENGIVMEVDVEIGLENDDYYEITSGLEEGDVVVTSTITE